MSRTTCLLCIDQGTHASRAALFGFDGSTIQHSSQPVALHAEEWVEQDARELLSSVEQVLTVSLDYAQHNGLEIVAAGLATQRSSVLAWDRESGEPLSPVISWQDRRTAQELTALEAHGEAITQRTGLRLSPHYSASKMRWLLDNGSTLQQAVRDGCLVLSPLASYLLYHLLAERPVVIDHANAQRTLLWNITTQAWDPWLLERFAIDPAWLPECVPTLAKFGTLDESAIPLRLCSGDQNAALYAWGEPQANRVQVNIGTGAFALAYTGNQVHHSPTLLSGLACSSLDSSSYVLEGTVNGAGAAFQWVAPKCGVTHPELLLTQWPRLAHEPSLFINSIGGLGSPWWLPAHEPRFIHADARICPADPNQCLVGVAESIAFLLNKNLECLFAAGIPRSSLLVSGGLAKLDGLCQTLADVSGLEVQRPKQVEATLRGGAWLMNPQRERWQVLAHDRFPPVANAGLRQRYQRTLTELEKLVP